MRTLILFLILGSFGSSAMAQIRLEGWEPDYVWAALKPTRVSDQGYASGMQSPRTYHVAQLWKRPAGPWKPFAEAALLKVRAELVGAGWEVKDLIAFPVKEGSPCSLAFEAKKESGKLRFYITLIPADDESFHASYVQTAI